MRGKFASLLVALVCVQICYSAQHLHDTTLVETTPGDIDQMVAAEAVTAAASVKAQPSSTVQPDTATAWGKWLLHMVVVILLCAAASPSPVAFPLAFAFAFQSDWVKDIWSWGWHTMGPTYFIAVGIPFCALATYWLHGLLLLAIDCYWRPEVIQQYKIQKSKRFDTVLIGKVVRNLVFNQVFVVLPVGALYAWFFHNGIGLYVTEELPGPAEMVGHIVLNIVTNEVLFYYGHRLFHESKWLYKNVHKIHHEHTAPIGLVASYCHPFEMLVSNILPLTSAGVIFGSHLYTLLIWTVFAVFGTQYHHCGYKMPWSPPFDEHPHFHDFHHEVFKTNYGALGWLDALHGTDKMWKDRIAREEKAKSHEKVWPEKSVSGNAFRIHLKTVAVICVMWLSVAMVPAWQRA